MSNLASDGSRLICTCSRTYRADTLEDDYVPPTEVLMQAPVTPQGTSSSGGRTRRQPKPGEREAIAERRERGLRNFEQQQAGALGRPDRAAENRAKMVPVRMAADELDELDAVASAAGMSRSDFLRRGATMLMGVMAAASKRAVTG